MLTNILIFVQYLPISYLALVYFLFKKVLKVQIRLKPTLRFLENTEKQIESLQNRFKESLENVYQRLFNDRKYIK